MPNASDDRSERELDDVDDRDELRQRHYGLLQELRVVIPGVQVLLAFLLTAPFAERFEDLDDRGRTLYAVALVAALASVTALLAPTLMHRLGDRQARRDRLMWGIRLMLLGLAALAVALLATTWCVVRFVYGPSTAVTVATGATVVLLAVWVGIPTLLMRRRTSG